LLLVAAWALACLPLRAAGLRARAPGPVQGARQPTAQRRAPGGGDTVPVVAGRPVMGDGEGAGMVKTLYWFRKALRLHDNPSLVRAMRDASHLTPVFCLDPWFVKSGAVGANRMKFLLESLSDLDAGLGKLDSRLLVLQGNPIDELPRVFKAWGIKRLAFEHCTEPYAKERDAKIRELCAAHGVEVVTEIGHTLCDPAELAAMSKGQPVTSYTSFCNHFNAVVKKKPIEVAPDVTALPPLCPLALREATEKGYAVPSLADIGYDAAEATTPFKGGESVARAQMAKYLKDKKWVCEFEKPQTSPTIFEPLQRSTTVLSPYLKFGCLSPRLFYSELKAIYKAAGKHTQPPVSLEGQLLWREFYYTCSVTTPNYDKMVGNPICRQIPWGARDDPVYVERLAAWREARTGYPFIDAIMTQLKQEGHVHHLARHMVACFLTRGDFWVHWEEGAKVFDELLIDADLALNVGNWMWLSCSCFFYQYFRCYSPVAFGKKYDPEGKYIKHYLPALKNFPKAYIYEPWKAPLDVQKKAGVIIGTDYPKPMVQHDVASKENMAKMNAAYAAHKAGGGGGDAGEGSKGSPAKKTAGSSGAGAKEGEAKTAPKRSAGEGGPETKKLKQTKLV